MTWCPVRALLPPSPQSLSKYFPDGDSLPPLLQQLKQQYTSSSSTGDAAHGDNSEAAAGGDGVGVSGAALGAVGLMVTFLRSNMLDQALLPHAKYEPLCEGVSDIRAGGVGGRGQDAQPMCAGSNWTWMAKKGLLHPSAPVGSRTAGSGAGVS